MNEVSNANLSLNKFIKVLNAGSGTVLETKTTSHSDINNNTYGG